MAFSDAMGPSCACCGGGGGGTGISACGCNPAPASISLTRAMKPVDPAVDADILFWTWWHDGSLVYYEADPGTLLSTSGATGWGGAGWYSPSVQAGNSPFGGLRYLYILKCNAGRWQLTLKAEGTAGGWAAPRGPGQRVDISIGVNQPIYGWDPAVAGNSCTPFALSAGSQDCGVVVNFGAAYYDCFRVDISG